ncbi:MAG: hypothetical protein M0Z77_08755 [Thermoplasmatales archaeon]|nr:hypothetical protein [Thermoplasmatales archaeon]
MKYKGGTVIASDTRVMFGLIRKRDGQNKVCKVNDRLVLASAGLIGASDDILEELLGRREISTASFDEIVEALSNLTSAWWANNKAKFDGSETRGPDFVLASKDKIRVIYGNGYSEEIKDYCSVGSGDTYGDFILQNEYSEDLPQQDAKELAVYIITQTSKVDPTVGEGVSLALFNNNGKLIEPSKKEIEQITSQFHRNLFARSTEGQKAEKIVLLRDEINNLFSSNFGEKLFLPQEKAILKLHETCKNENEFSLLISSLDILIDEVNLDGIRKLIPGVDRNKKSIGLLNGLLQSKGVKDYKVITDGFDKIRILRSAHFPIHKTESEFTDLVIKLVEKYPPDWSELWNRSLELYLDTLNKLLGWSKKLTSAQVKKGKGDNNHPKISKEEKKKG